MFVGYVSARSRDLSNKARGVPPPPSSPSTLPHVEPDAIDIMYEGLWAMKNGNRKVERGAKLGLNTRKPVMRACLHCMLSLHMQVFAFLKIQPRMCGDVAIQSNQWYCRTETGYTGYAEERRTICFLLRMGCKAGKFVVF
jgi:hypothetical protein